MNLEDQLARSLNSFATDGLFVIGGIPHDKLSNAIQNFPIDPLDTVLALIDATVMGSCKKGMAFGLRGVYWKNDWTTKTQRNYMSWDELSSIKHLIGAKSFDVILGPGNACNLSGAYVKPPQASNLLHQLIDVYNDFKAASQQQQTAQPVVDVPAVQQTVVEQAVPALPSPAASSPAPDRYAQGLPKALAVMVCADGELEEGEIDLAVQFLEAEDNIADKAAAIESLTTVIEELRAEYAKSKPLFKLKCSKLIAQVRDEITGPSREHARVMLEGMLGETKDSADAANREVFDKLMAALAD